MNLFYYYLRNVYVLFSDLPLFNCLHSKFCHSSWVHVLIFLLFQSLIYVCSFTLILYWLNIIFHIMDKFLFYYVRIWNRSFIISNFFNLEHLLSLIILILEGYPVNTFKPRKLTTQKWVWNWKKQIAKVFNLKKIINSIFHYHLDHYLQLNVPPKPN